MMIETHLYSLSSVLTTFCHWCASSMSFRDDLDLVVLLVVSVTERLMLILLISMSVAR